MDENNNKDDNQEDDSQDAIEEQELVDTAKQIGDLYDELISKNEGVEELQKEMNEIIDMLERLESVGELLLESARSYRTYF